MLLTGEIYMIRWGLFPAPSPTYNVGVGYKVANGKLKVMAIVRKDREDGTFEYEIHCAPINEKNPPETQLGEVFVWKVYYLRPDEVIYHIPDGKHDYKLI